MSGAGSGGCVRGQRWQWDGVDFRVLHPPAAAGWEGNNRSCVLRIAAGEHTALLTGDIETVAEISLLDDLGAGALEATVLVAPHHGSRTSSSPAFVAATRPEHLLVPAGWRNRHEHPDAQVLRRWRDVDARIDVTGHAGSLWLRLGQGIDTPKLQRARDSRRIWRAPPTEP